MRKLVRAFAGHTYHIVGNFCNGSYGPAHEILVAAKTPDKPGLLARAFTANAQAFSLECVPKN